MLVIVFVLLAIIRVVKFVLNVKLLVIIVHRLVFVHLVFLPLIWILMGNAYRFVRILHIWVLMGVARDAQIIA